MLRCKAVFYLSSDVTCGIFLGVSNFVHHINEQCCTRPVVYAAQNLEITGYMHSKQT